MSAPSCLAQSHQMELSPTRSQMAGQDAAIWGRSRLPPTPLHLESQLNGPQAAPRGLPRPQAPALTSCSLYLGQDTDTWVLPSQRSVSGGVPAPCGLVGGTGACGGSDRALG